MLQLDEKEARQQRELLTGGRPLQWVGTLRWGERDGAPGAEIDQPRLWSLFITKWPSNLITAHIRIGKTAHLVYPGEYGF